MIGDLILAEDFAYPLTVEQLYFYDYQKTAPDTTMYNPYPVLFKLRDFVDPEKFAQTLVKNLQAHPAFLSVIEEHNGIPVQGYVLAKVPSIPVEKIADADLLRIKFTHAPQNFHDGQDIEPDAWFAYLQEREAPKSSPHYAESKKWHEDFYGHHDFYGYHAADFAVLEGGSTSKAFD